MTTQPMIEQLIAAQLDFLDCELAQPDTLQQEFTAFYHWLSSQQLQQLCSVEQIYNLLEKQVLATPASAFLIEQIATHIGFALQHPLNQNTRIEAVIPVATIDHIAQSCDAHSRRIGAVAGTAEAMRSALDDAEHSLEETAASVHKLSALAAQFQVSGGR